MRIKGAEVLLYEERRGCYMRSAVTKWRRDRDRGRAAVYTRHWAGAQHTKVHTQIGAWAARGSQGQGQRELETQHRMRWIRDAQRPHPRPRLH